MFFKTTQQSVPLLGGGRGRDTDKHIVSTGIKVKVNQSHYSPEQTQRFPES